MTTIDRFQAAGNCGLFALRPDVAPGQHPGFARPNRSLAEVQADPRYRSDAKLLAAILDVYCLAGWKFSAWPTIPTLAAKLGWDLRKDGGLVPDGGKKRVQRALAELIAGGDLARFRIEELRDWFAAEGEALGLAWPKQLPRSRKMSASVCVLGWKVPLGETAPAAHRDTGVPVWQSGQDTRSQVARPEPETVPLAGGEPSLSRGTPASPPSSNVRSIEREEKELTSENRDGRSSFAGSGGGERSMILATTSHDRADRWAALSPPEREAIAERVKAREGAMPASLLKLLCLAELGEEGPAGVPWGEGGPRRFMHARYPADSAREIAGKVRDTVRNRNHRIAPGGGGSIVIEPLSPKADPLGPEVLELVAAFEPELLALLRGDPEPRKGAPGPAVAGYAPPVDPERMAEFEAMAGNLPRNTDPGAARVAAAALGSALGDPKPESLETWEGYCHAVRSGRMEASDLIRAFRRACSPKARDRGRLMVNSVQRSKAMAGASGG